MSISLHFQIHSPFSVFRNIFNIVRFIHKITYLRIATSHKILNVGTLSKKMVKELPAPIPIIYYHLPESTFFYLNYIVNRFWLPPITIFFYILYLVVILFLSAGHFI